MHAFHSASALHLRPGPANEAPLGWPWEPLAAHVSLSQGLSNSVPWSGARPSPTLPASWFRPGRFDRAEQPNKLHIFIGRWTNRAAFGRATVVGHSIRQRPHDQSALSFVDHDLVFVVDRHFFEPSVLEDCPGVRCQNQGRETPAFGC